MKKGFRLFLLLTVTCMLLVTYVTPVYAESSVSPRLVNGDSSSLHFTVYDGLAHFQASYYGKSATFTKATLEVQVQKKFLGLFWRDVGDEWKGTCTDLYGDIYGTVPADGSGTYRALFKLCFHGTTGQVDVIEDEIQVKYSE